MNYQIGSDVEAWTNASPALSGSMTSRPSAKQNESTEVEPLLATASQVAKLMQISTRTLWRLLSGGRVPEPLRIGGAVRWRLDIVKAWIEAGCPSPIRK
jgi:predicted DNA-binding transcriptional regulator AlpA